MCGLALACRYCIASAGLCISSADLDGEVDVGLLRDVLRSRAPRLLRRIRLRAGQPALEPAPDRLAEIAALQRAGEIAQDGVAIGVDRIWRGWRAAERQHAVTRAAGSAEDVGEYACHGSILPLAGTIRAP